MARLKGIQKSLAIKPNNYLVNLERELKAEFAKVSKLEEELWAIKPRILWLEEGDRNTNFYHTSALLCRRRNRILCKKDRISNWIDGDRAIADFIK